MQHCKNITITLIILTLVLGNLFLVTDFVLATEGFGRITDGFDKTAEIIFGTSTPPSRDLPEIIGILVRGALSLLGVIYLIMLIIGGFMWVGSKGNEEVVTKSKDIIVHASVGLCMTLVAYAVTAFLLEYLSTAAGLKDKFPGASET